MKMAVIYASPDGRYLRLEAQAMDEPRVGQVRLIDTVLVLQATDPAAFLANEINAAMTAKSMDAS